MPSKRRFGELAHRVDGGVTLLGSARENRIAVTVSDSQSGESFVLDVENDRALDPLYHRVRTPPGRPRRSNASRVLVSRCHPRARPTGVGATESRRAADEWKETR
jgi:hypothetical protein